jgi:hypothetical protein
MVEHCFSYDDEYTEKSYTGFETKVLNVRQLWQYLHDHSLRGWDRNDYAKTVISSILKNGKDTEEDYTWFFVEENYLEFVKKEEKKKQEKTRKNLENRVVTLAKSLNVSPISSEFIKSLYNIIQKEEYALERFDDFECRQERFADSYFSGQSREGFWSDEDYSRSEISREIQTAVEALEYLSNVCPLLIMQTIPEYVKN